MLVLRVAVNFATPKRFVRCLVIISIIAIVTVLSSAIIVIIISTTTTVVWESCTSVATISVSFESGHSSAKAYSRSTSLTLSGLHVAVVHHMDLPGGKRVSAVSLSTGKLGSHTLM